MALYIHTVVSQVGERRQLDGAGPPKLPGSGVIN